MVLLLLFITDFYFSDCTTAKAGEIKYLAIPGKLQSEQPKYIEAHLSRLWISDWYKYRSAKDEVGAAEALAKGHALLLEPGTEIKLLSTEYVPVAGERMAFHEYRVLSGPHQDKKLMSRIIHVSDRNDKKPSRPAGKTGNFYKSIGSDLPKVGSVYTLAYDGAKQTDKRMDVFVARTPSALEIAADALLKAKDEIAKRQVIKGDVDASPTPTLARVIQSKQGKHGYYCEVEMIDGPVSGNRCWVLSMFLCEVEKLDNGVKVGNVLPDEAVIKKYDEKAAWKRQAAADGKKAAEDEEKASELLKHAKRWLAEGEKELSKKRLQDLLKRFPNSSVAPEAKKLLEGM